MSPLRRILATLLALAVAVVAAPPARAQGKAEADSGRFIIYQGDTPLAREQNVFQWMGDSLVVTALHESTLRDETGARHPFQKVLALTVDSRDLGLVSYMSTQQFQGRTLTRGLVPGDTSISYYVEDDGIGNGVRLVQPPGRLFVMDNQLFTLFEVVSRSLASRTFTTRSVQLLALGDSMTTPVATVTRLAADTLRFGSRRVPGQHYRFADASADFELWTDTRGRMLKLTHAMSGLRVEREPDPVTPARRRTRAR